MSRPRCRNGKKPGSPWTEGQLRKRKAARRLERRQSLVAVPPPRIFLIANDNRSSPRCLPGRPTALRSSYRCSRLSSASTALEPAFGSSSARASAPANALGQGRPRTCHHRPTIRTEPAAAAVQLLGRLVTFPGYPTSYKRAEVAGDQPRILPHAFRRSPPPVLNSKLARNSVQRLTTNASQRPAAGRAGGSRARLRTLARAPRHLYCRPHSLAPVFNV